MPASSPPNSGPNLRAPRVLLVDDDPIVLRALRRLLLSARPGWEIDIAESGEAALRLLKDRSYDVAVTDLHMPGMDGDRLLARLKLEHPALMRVVHSSHAEALSERKVQELAHAVLNKPGLSDELVNLLDWALSQRRRRVRDSMGL